MMKLSKAQAETLDLLTNKFFTPAQVSNKRGVTRQAVNKTIHKLLNKGYLKDGYNKGLTKLPPRSPGTDKKYYRWHGLQFDISIIRASSFYQFTLKKGNKIYHDGNTCMLYKNKIEIYQAKGSSFIGETVNSAFEKAMDTFNKIFLTLEHRLKILFIKDGSQNIKLVAGHCAEMKNEVAIYELNNANEKITIYGRDGKAWFKIDNSMQLEEAETIHPETAKEDAQNIFEKHLNAWRDNPGCPTTPELTKLVEANAIQLKYYGEHWKSHVKFVQEATVLMKAIRKEMKSGHFLSRSSRRSSPSQLYLQSYM